MNDQHNKSAQNEAAAARWKRRVDMGIPISATIAKSDCLVFSVFTDHNRYGEELQGVFLEREEAEKLKAHLDSTVNAWENTIGGIIRETVAYRTFEAWEIRPDEDDD